VTTGIATETIGAAATEAGPAAIRDAEVATKRHLMARLEDVSKIYETAAAQVTALERMTWEIGRGEAVALMGPSGCGKTTVLNMLGGMDRPTGGAIWVDGANIAAMSERQLETYRLTKVGFVFQFFNLIPSLSAVENLELPMLMAGVDAVERRDRAEMLLETVGLKQKGFKRPEELSGGEQQRVAVCLALVNDPAMILADEPTGNLDSKNGQIICDLLVGLAAKEGKTVLVASHDPKVVESFPRVFHMRDGMIERAA
jgi:putative ABC transport system ATP-binding protein